MEKVATAAESEREIEALRAQLAVQQQKAADREREITAWRAEHANQQKQQQATISWWQEELVRQLAFTKTVRSSTSPRVRSSC